MLVVNQVSLTVLMVIRALLIRVTSEFEYKLLFPQRKLKELNSGNVRRRAKSSLVSEGSDALPVCALRLARRGGTCRSLIVAGGPSTRFLSGCVK